MGILCAKSDQSNIELVQSKVIKEQIINNLSICICHGDICSESVDAIVHPNIKNVDTSQILIKAGHKVTPGKSYYTSAGHLRCKYIIHMVLPTWRGVNICIYFFKGNYGEKEFLKKCMFESIKLVDHLNLMSVAFVDFSSSGIAYPFQTCSTWIMENIVNFALSAKLSKIITVKFIFLDMTKVKNYVYEFEQSLLEIRRYHSPSFEEQFLVSGEEDYYKEKDKNTKKLLLRKQSCSVEDLVNPIENEYENGKGKGKGKEIYYSEQKKKKSIICKESNENKKNNYLMKESIN